MRKAFKLLLPYDYVRSSGNEKTPCQRENGELGTATIPYDATVVDRKMQKNKTVILFLLGKEFFQVHRCPRPSRAKADSSA